MLIYATSNAICGTTFITSEVYGFNAFMLTVVLLLEVLAFNIPVIPCCIIYQICYILRKKTKRFNNVNLKKYIIICFIIGFVLITAWTLWSHLYV